MCNYNTGEDVGLRLDMYSTCGFCYEIIKCMICSYSQLASEFTDLKSKLENNTMIQCIDSRFVISIN